MKRNAIKYEKNIAEEMENDIEKYFNNEDFFCTNQQVLSMRDALRGLVAKEWMLMNVENIDCAQHNKQLITEGVSLYCGCWNQLCVMFHDATVQKQYLQKDIIAIKTKEEVE